jgi:hypothetical protein
MAQTACSCTATSPASRAASTRVTSVSRAAPRRARHHMSLPRRQAPRRCLGGVLVSSALLSCRLLKMLLLAVCLSLLAQQAACCTSASSNSAPAGARRFPQPLGTTRGCVRWRLPGDSRRGVPKQQRGATSRWLSGGRRPWLAHKRSQRYACLRSRPRTGQCSPAHKDAARLDCPRERLGCQATFLPPIGSATRSNGRCALPHLTAPQGVHTEGTGAAALCPCRCFLLTPPSPLRTLPLAPLRRVAMAPRPTPCGDDRALTWVPRPVAGPLRSLLPPWTARNVLPQSSCVKAWPSAALRMAAPGTSAWADL